MRVESQYRERLLSRPPLADIGSVHDWWTLPIRHIAQIAQPLPTVAAGSDDESGSATLSN